jgi:hypothetical protein
MWQGVRREFILLKGINYTWTEGRVKGYLEKSFGVVMDSEYCSL